MSLAWLRSIILGIIFLPSVASMSLIVFVFHDVDFPPLLHWVWIVPAVICVSYGTLLQSIASKLNRVLKRSHVSNNDTHQADRFQHQLIPTSFQSVVMVSLVLMPIAYAMYASLESSDFDPLSLVTLILPPMVVWVLLRALMVQQLMKVRRFISGRKAAAAAANGDPSAPPILTP